MRSDDNLEETLLFFKPDGMIMPAAQQATLDYLSIFGLDIRKERLVQPERGLLAEHYEDLQGRLPDHVFEEILGYVMGDSKAFQEYHEHLKRTYPQDGIADSFSGYLRAYHIVGEDAVSKVRTILGPTNPGKTHDDEGNPLSLGLRIRYQFGSTHNGGIYNTAHATSGPENAPEELERFGFTPLYTSLHK